MEEIAVKKHWNKTTRQYEENKKIDDFLDDLIRVYKKHDLALRHEDTQGAFIVSPLSQYNILWLQDAMIEDSSQNRIPAKKKETPAKRKKGQFKFHLPK